MIKLWYLQAPSELRAERELYMVFRAHRNLRHCHLQFCTFKHRTTQYLCKAEPASAHKKLSFAQALAGKKSI